jgi:hypothetical protein
MFRNCGSKDQVEGVVMGKQVRKGQCCEVGGGYDSCESGVEDR